jgi:hypothetical protein
LCLTLRDTAGQPARVLTGYDLLLVPILVEAQQGRLPTATAGPCPLRGFRTAAVVDSATPAMRAGAATALLAGGAGLADKVADGDVPRWLSPVAVRLHHRASASADACGLDGTELVAAPARAKAAEERPGATLDELLAPSAAAAASVFAHTATIAGVGANVEPLHRAGDAFGRLVHLVDAAEDRRRDARQGHFNPLDATATSDRDAAELARRLHDQIVGWLDQGSFVDDALLRALLGPTLAAAIRRTWPDPAKARTAVGLAAALTVLPALWSRRRRRYDPYDDGAYYARRRGCGGMGCGEMLACNCCANCACNECCGGDSCCCVC